MVDSYNMERYGMADTGMTSYGLAGFGMAGTPDLEKVVSEVWVLSKDILPQPANEIGVWIDISTWSDTNVWYN